MRYGIDMTLLPEPWRSKFVAVASVSEGESIERRSTLRIGDLLLRAGARSLTVYEPEKLLVGRDVSVDALYPNLWSDWAWA